MLLQLERTCACPKHTGITLTNSAKHQRPATTRALCHACQCHTPIAPCKSLHPASRLPACNSTNVLVTIPCLNDPCSQLPGQKDRKHTPVTVWRKHLRRFETCSDRWTVPESCHEAFKTTSRWQRATACK